LQVQTVIRGSWVFEFCRWDSKVEGVGYHFLTDSPAEFLDVAANVPKEGVAAPTAEEHDDVNWYSLEIHGHSGSTAKGMEAHLFGSIA
jgi:hypothetical protein